MKCNFRNALCCIMLSSYTLVISHAQTLIQNFQSPPPSSRPRVWWHWMNGNITKEGIQKDLEWMSRIGIGGFHNFDANLFTPVVVPKKLVFMTPEWKDAFKFTTELADKKGLEMTIAGSPGWSVTGGPWVEPQDAMKKYVWTETIIEGGKEYFGAILKPAITTGKFQNVSLPKAGTIGDAITVELPTHYQDVALLAFRLPNTEQSLLELNPKVTSSGGDFKLKDLTDGDLDFTVLLPPLEVGQDMWIQYEFDHPQSFKAFSLSGASHEPLEDFNGGPNNRSLKVSDDGINFRDIAKVSGSIVPQNTVSIKESTAKYWRITFKTLPPPFNLFATMFGGGSGEPPKPEGVQVAEFVLFKTDRIDQFEDKAGFTPWRESYEISKTKTTDAIQPSDVIDLSSKLGVDGKLKWLAPEGRWVIMRFGYSLTGRQNHPASPEATGLEVDKLDKEAVRKYINTYLNMYKEATGGMMGLKGLQYMVLDSYEAGPMTWTKTMAQEFQKRRGYNILPWMPVLAGRVIQSIDASEKFLWDFRKTIGELIAENHYDVIGEELHKRGMKRYTESHEDRRIYLADGMDVKRYADIPMSAMWTPGSLAAGADEEPRSEGDIRESASVANIYGQRIIAAESMTSIQNAFTWHPEKLKRTADLELASGLNRFVIHTSVHQPLDDKRPGFSLGPFGQYFTRQETWAEQAKSWIDYLSRSCYFLQQGKNIADILYYYGENNNITWICREKLPNIPQGFEFDFVNASALINVIQAKNGKLVAPSGNTYQVLMLDESAQWMTLPVLKKIKTLVLAGVKVVGVKPLMSPSQTDDDQEFQKIASEVWSHPNVTSFDSLHLQPDVLISHTANKFLYRHRHIEAMDIYWLNNRSEKATKAEVSFRISNKIPELWNAQTGKMEKVSYESKNGRTKVQLKFESWDAYFILFREKTRVKSYTLPIMSETMITSISTPWKVNINNNSLTLDHLISWSEHTNPDIKYYSGTAIYENSFKLTGIQKKGNYSIDLGEVKNIAEVNVNGKNLGILWKKPFRMDISQAVKEGENNIQIKVTNLWVNRLIGDAQPDVKVKTTFTTMPFYQANAPLLPSGLMGPVVVYRYSK